MKRDIFLKIKIENWKSVFFDLKKYPKRYWFLKVSTYIVFDSKKKKKKKKKKKNLKKTKKKKKKKKKKKIAFYWVFLDNKT